MTDEQIIADCVSNDRMAQKKLYEQYSGQMYSICLRYCKDVPTASDAMQMGFVKVFKSISDYNKSGSLGAWIRRIIINACLDRLKIEKKHLSTELENSNIDLSYHQEINFDNFNYNKLLDLLDHLAEGYRLVFSMYVLDDLSHKEIAKILDISTATSRSQLLKARKQMQTLIKADKYLSLQYINE